MSKIAIVTDSNSGITQSEGKTMGITVLPMPFYINEELFWEDITLTQEEFYKKLEEDADISTSQPAPGDVMDLWDGLLKEYDEIIHIPMSSGLSSSCETAISLAAEYDGKVQVVNNQRISVTQRQSVLEAKALADNGAEGAEIKAILEKTRYESHIYIMVDTLEYLKKGGRITPAAAMVASVLNIKPVLQIQGDKLDAFAKVRGMKAAKKRMITALEDDMNRRFSSIPRGELRLEAAYTCSDEEAFQWKQMLEEHFGQACDMSPLPLSIACHTGPGALGCAFTRQYIG